ncbi:DUF5662 family protein [Deinococcus kurensis]|uniref:DUF5662 family protein n=1 Tax=Deinococcus kurensis TaxID=2662757 RepID=UPI0012D33EB9|nr:DUF5662 family protein [Deinococcus kurensis]
MTLDELLACWRYAALTARHKRYVYAAGRKLGVSRWQLLVHDLSKFTPAELPHYARQFFMKPTVANRDAFAAAWLHHQNTNPHHWEYWVPRTGHTLSLGSSQSAAMPMPRRYVNEMVADWLGAGRAYEGRYPDSLDGWTWLHANLPKMTLHPMTRIYMWDAISRYFR